MSTIAWHVAFVALEENWDSYGAKPIDYRAITTAQLLLDRVKTAPLLIAPLASGEVQLEYRGSCGEITIECRDDLRYNFCVGDYADPGHRKVVSYYEQENLSLVNMLLVLRTIVAEENIDLSGFHVR